MSELSTPVAARRRRCWVPWAWLGALVGWTSAAHGQTDLVRVTCPQLSSEQAAEIEARVRASLLTSEIRAAVTIVCESESATVRIESSGGDAAVETLATSANLREELIGALDRAFEKLAQRPASTDSLPTVDEAAAAPGAVAAPASATAVAALPKRPPPIVQRGLTSASSEPSTRTGVSTRAASLPVFVRGLGELWSSQLAWGGELGSEWALGSLRYGASAGALTPVLTDPTFKLVDWQAILRVGVRPSWASGAQLTASLGLSWMVVSPRGEATSYAVSVVSAPFAFVSVARPVRFGHFAILPELGARLFASERGVKVNQRERVTFGWLVPRLAFGLAYVSD